MNNAQIEYERQAINQSSPEELISKLYEMVIQSCHKQDKKKAKDVLDALIKSLNFDFEISTTLYELYSYCQQILDDNKFDEVRSLIEPIRSAWDDGVVKNRMKSTQINRRGFLA